MNEFRFICSRLILDERVLKILSVTERHTSVSKVQHTKNAVLVDTTLLKRLNLWIFNKNRESALCEVLLG